MMFQFFRETLSDTVNAKIICVHEGKVSEIGTLRFPSKMTWSTFFGAIQAGSVPMRDLEIRMENAVNLESEKK